MSGFTLRRRSTLSAEQAWSALTDWQAHSRHVPLTTVQDQGHRVVATTALGPLRLADTMDVVQSDPPADGRPGRLELVKTGAVHGGAVVEVRPTTDGCEVIWTETARLGPAPLRRLSGPVQDAVGRLAFGRLVSTLLRDGERQAAGQQHGGPGRQDGGPR